MYRITTQKKVQIASPNQGWSLTPGANHFESEMPEAVALEFSKLEADGVVTVETIDSGNVHDWKPPEPK